MRMEKDWVIHPKQLSRQLPRWWYPGFWWLLLAWVRINPVQSWLSVPAVRRRFCSIQVVFLVVQMTLQFPRQCLPFCLELPQGNVGASSVFHWAAAGKLLGCFCRKDAESKGMGANSIAWSWSRCSASAKWLSSGLVTGEIAGFAYQCFIIHLCKYQSDWQCEMKIQWMTKICENCIMVLVQLNRKWKQSAILSKVNAFFNLICSNSSIHNEYPGKESLFKG